MVVVSVAVVVGVVAVAVGGGGRGSTTVIYPAACADRATLLQRYSTCWTDVSMLQRAVASLLGMCQSRGGGSGYCFHGCRRSLRYCLPVCLLGSLLALLLSPLFPCCCQHTCLCCGSRLGSLGLLCFVSCCLGFCSCSKPLCGLRVGGV